MSPNPVVADRRAKVAELRLRGLSCEEIARRLNAKLGTIEKDLQRLRMAWRHDVLGSIGQIVAEEFAKLSEDERTIRDRWLRTDDPIKAVAVYDRILAICRRRAELLGLDGADALRLTETQFDAFAKAVGMAVQRCVSDPAERRAIGAEVARMLEESVGVRTEQATRCNDKPQSSASNGS